MSVDQLFSQANAAFRAGDYAGAERRYRALTRLKPLFAWHNLGLVFNATGRWAEAEAAFRQALAIDPDLAASRFTLGLLLMADGRWAQGWPLMEARRQAVAANTPLPAMAYPEWRGEDLAGRRLTVVLEQGLGDQIMYFRFLPRLAAAGAVVTFVCHPALARLFEGRGVHIVRAGAGVPMPDGDYWAPIGSLVARLGLAPDTVPGDPYLAMPGSGGGGIGVMTAGNPTHANDRNRSLGPKAAAELAALGRSLAPEATGARDLRDTAELVAGLDLVISVDTAVAHLAGAMGKPVWILLPAAETDWRWLRGRADSPWYPSARLYRQARPGDWAPVLRQVKADLAGSGLQSLTR